MRKNENSVIDNKEDFFVKEESQTSISGASLEGTRLLRLKFTTYTCQKNYAKRIDENGKPFTSFVSKKLIEDASWYKDFQLKEVSSEELVTYRKSGVPGFVLKLGDKFYYTELMADISLFALNILGQHKCVCGETVCKRLSALSDEEGGCAKVRDFSYGIERYEWITKGYETFGTKHDMFVVVECDHYEACPPRQKISLEKRREMQLNLASFMWDDVETLRQVYERKRKNAERNAREANARAKDHNAK